MPMPADRPLNHPYLARVAISDARDHLTLATKHPDDPDADVTAIAAVAASGIAIANALLAVNETLQAMRREPTDI